MKHVLLRSALLLPALLLSSCSLLGLPNVNTGGQQVAPDPIAPDVSVAQVSLAHMPTAEHLAAHYCQELLPGIQGQLICRVLGPLPTPQDLEFAFDLELEVANPNQVPLPVVSALVAFTAFPDQAQGQRLGATCVTFCDDPNSCQESANACQDESNSPMIRDASDFAMAAAGFLIDVARGEASFDDLRLQTIAPNERVRVVVRLALAPTQMLNLMKELLDDTLASVRQGQVPTFQIPFSVEGTAWVNISGFGRLAAGFGPFSDTWTIAPQQ